MSAGGEQPFRATPGSRTDPTKPAVASGEVLDSQTGLPERFADRWARLPAVRRRFAVAALALTTSIAGSVLVMEAGREWRAESRLAEMVAVRASMGVFASSRSPIGGRVDYYVSVRNVGPRPVRVSDVRIVHGGLHMRGVDVPHAAIPPSGVIDVPLSVRLSCAPRPTSVRAAGLQGDLVVLAQNGRRRTVELTVTRAGPLLDVVETVCRVRPTLRDAELSGPVLPGRVG